MDITSTRIPDPPKNQPEFAVIGLLGPAGSGKDLVGDWFMGEGFAKVAFADPMKRFVMKTFGLNYDQLWGPSEERNREFVVDSSWWYNALGKMQEAAEEIVQEVLIDGFRVNGYLALMEWFTDLKKTYPDKISTRLILQTLGTEWGRTVDPLMWTRYAHKLADKIREEPGVIYSQEEGLWGPKMSMCKTPYRGVVIPDHRFINEVKMTQEKGGYVIRLRRLALEEKTVGISGHRSEAEQKGIPDEDFDLVLEFPEGVGNVYKMLEGARKEEAWKIKRRVQDTSS